MGKKKEAVAKISLVVRRIFLFFYLLSTFTYCCFFLIYQRMGILRMEKSIVLVTCMLLVVSSFVESNPIQSNRDEDCIEYGIEYDGSCSEQKQACCYGLKCKDSRISDDFACL